MQNTRAIAWFLVTVCLSGVLCSDALCYAHCCTQHHVCCLPAVRINKGDTLSLHRGSIEAAFQLRPHASSPGGPDFRLEPSSGLLPVGAVMVSMYNSSPRNCCRFSNMSVTQTPCLLLNPPCTWCSRTLLAHHRCTLPTLKTSRQDALLQSVLACCGVALQHTACHMCSGSGAGHPRTHDGERGGALLREL